MFRRPDFAGWRGGLESMAELAWLAGRHPAVRIGITAAVLPARDIDWLVRQAATLDQLTEGRFVLAVAAGFWDDELTYRGVPPAERGRALPAELAPLAARWGDLGGGLLAHRIYVEAGSVVPDGVHVERHVLAGSADQILDGLSRYRELGVADLSMVLGHDDTSAGHTLDILLTDVLAQL